MIFGDQAIFGVVNRRLSDEDGFVHLKKERKKKPTRPYGVISIILNTTVCTCIYKYAYTIDILYMYVYLYIH